MPRVEAILGTSLVAHITLAIPQSADKKQRVLGRESTKTIASPLKISLARALKISLEESSPRES